MVALRVRVTVAVHARAHARIAAPPRGHYLLQHEQAYRRYCLAFPGYLASAHASVAAP